MLALPVQAQNFAAAGAPRDMTEARDYLRLFTGLRADGMDYFFPTFQYQEIPAAKSPGFEGDFAAPCSPDAPVFTALRQTGMRLILPAELLYPAPAPFPPVAEDPLRALLDCAGKGGIYAVTTYDEAPDKGVPLARVRAFYQRVKAVAPELPVIMIHAPVLLDKPQYATRAQRRAYLESVVEYAAYGDIVGFDVYPVPQSLAKIAPPDGSDTLLPPAETVAAYLDWMARRLPDKSGVIVLQGFGIRDMYAPAYRDRNFAPALVEQARPPDTAELAGMLAAVRNRGVDLVVWWGQAMLKTADQAPWPDIVHQSGL